MTRVAGDVAINVSADVGPLVTNMGKGESSLDRFGKTANRVKGSLGNLDKQTTRFSRRLSNTTSVNRRFTMGVQNAAFQVGDFAVQVGGGVDASRALAQQLPQLLGGFGVLGAVLGAAAAIIIPLRSAMQGLATDGQDVTRVFGTLQPVIEKINVSMKALGAIALDGAELVVNNIDRIITVGATAAAFFAGKWVAGMVAARIATFSFAGSLVALRTALIRTGIGAIVIAAGEAVYQFTRLASAAGGFGNALGLLVDVGKEAFEKIGASMTILKTNFQLVINDMQFAWVTGLGRMASQFAAFMDSIASVAPGFMNLEGGNAEAVAKQTADQMKAINDELVGVMSEQEDARDVLAKPLESLQAIRDLIASMKEDNITLDSIFGNLGGAAEDGAGGGKKSPVVQELEAQKWALEQLRESAHNTYSALGGFLQQFAGKSKAAAIAAIAIQKGLSIAQIISNTAAAQLRALAELGPIAGPPVAAKIGLFGKVQAALVAATGLAQAAGGGGGGGASGISSAATAAQSQPNTSPRVAVTLQGDMFSKSQVRDLINAINEEVEGGAIVRLA